MFGQNVQRERKKQGKSCEELGRECECTGKMIDHIEKGIRQPSFALVVSIAEALGCTIDELVYGKKTG